MNPRDLELLSAYLDGQLAPPDSARLESRLASDESLRARLNDLRSTRGLLRQLPARRVPRNFTLTPQMAGLQPPTPRVVPVFRLATALATFLFFITLVINGLVLRSATSAMAARAPAPLSAAQGPAHAATQAPALPPALNALGATSAPRTLSAAPRMTEAPGPSAAGGAPLPTEISTPVVALKSNAPQLESGQPVRTQTGPSVPFDLEVLFGILALGFGGTAWILPRKYESNLRKKWNKK
ncbi:MAG TPA: hypothetical protein VLZ89_06670 [Anaerolineales bacterium]|nr:hypothetical protein [Anaerolineales bacterium]